MLKISVTFCFIILIVGKTFSQDQELPDVIPPSPEAAEFQKYGEIPVDYSTGVPNISIPIYNVRSGQLSMPISISYHASGIKVDDVSSVVGLGWNLNVGGVVSRTILDYPDEGNQKNNYKTKAELDAARLEAGGDIYARVDVGDNVRDDFNGPSISPSPKDSYSDRYYYQLPGGSSGIFRYNYLVGNGLNDDNMEVITMPHQNYIIDQIRTDEVHPEILGFLITDDNGTKYYFETGECKSYRENGKFYPTAWHISKIISADQIDTVRFIYANYTNEYLKLNKAEGYSISTNSSCGFGTHSPSWSYNRIFCSPLIEKIITRNTTLKLDYKGDRKDVNSGQYRLQKIAVFDRYSKTRKHLYTFNQSYFGADGDNNQRMRLDGLILNDGTSNPSKYAFEYDNRTLDSDLEDWQYDHWGFYTNKKVSASLPVGIRKLLHWSYLTDERIEDQFKGNRHPNGDAKECMLEEIHFPTGGKTVFTFERHQITNPFVYDYGNQPGTVEYGGLRVANIKSYADVDDTTPAFERTYQYASPSFQVIHKGLYQYEILKAVELLANENPSCKTSKTQITNSSTFHPLESVKYRRVTEILGNETNNIGKNVYHYEIPEPSYQYDNIEYEFNPRFTHRYQNDYGMRNPILEFKREYGKDNTLVKTTEYRYVKHRTGPEYEYHTGVHIVNKVDYSPLPLFYKNLNCNNVNGVIICAVDLYLDDHEYRDTKAYDEHNLLEAEIVTDHISGVKTETFYAYDNDMHSLPTRKTIKNSKGLSQNIDYTYVADLNDGIYDVLKSKNILNPVVQKVSYNNGQHVETVTTNFADVSSESDGYPIPKPINIEVVKGLASDPTRVLYHKYDNKGNVLEVSREDNMHICYIWGYRQSLPVAKIENATYDEIEAFLDISSIQDFSGQALRDALEPLRTSLPNSMVTTFTYDPVIGVVSQVDPNGKLITYDYNDSAQLEEIKDDGSIVKLFFYQYKP